MKKFGKFVFTLLSVGAFAASAYYLLKNVIYKDYDEFDDFDDEFDDFYFDEEGSAQDGREYVTLNMNQETSDDDETPEDALLDD
jgi:hypothetical protein